MILKRTSDKHKIREILTHVSIYKNIGGQENEGFEIPIDNDHHYLWMPGGLFILHPEGEDWKIHANVLPDYRAKAFEAGQEAFEYAFKELGARKVIASIPIEYSNVYNFALKSGMKDSGLKGGEHYLTLRYEEWVL